MALPIPNRPGRGRAWVESLLEKHGLKVDKAILVGCRGYLRDSMGKPGVNDRGIYDDALFLISPNAFVSFNFNTDPTAAYRHGLATLQAGKVWTYKLGIHGITTKPKPPAGIDNDPRFQYPALVQADKVTVLRDGKGADVGYFGINIHMGGRTTTSSLGCQTIPPDQWMEFIELVRAQMTRYRQDTIAYLLVEQQG